MDLILSALATNIGEFLKSFLKFFVRCLDRKGKISTQANPEDEDDDGVNSKKPF
jgi:hypothetical protein